MNHSLFFKDYCFENTLVHSDINFGISVPFKKETFLKDHLYKLYEITNDSELFFPSFNYDFLKNNIYDISLDKSQVGILSEYFRQTTSSWRSKVPVFSFTGNKPLKLILRKTIDPFDENSFFNYLYNNNSAMMHYGSSFRTTTLIHYVERISKFLFYRYDKVFNGYIYDNKNLLNETSFLYHVRPHGYKMDYNWNKLEKDLVEQGILITYKNRKTKIMYFCIKELVDFWLDKIKEDNFYFLNNESKNWIIPMVDKLGRGFKITDFE